MPSPEIKRHMNNNTPHGGALDDVLDFSGEYSPPKVSSNRRSDSKTRQSKDRLPDLSDSEILMETLPIPDKSSNARISESKGSIHSSSPNKKIGRRGGEERKRLAGSYSISVEFPVYICP
jgi:hypothetical protein